MRAQKPLNWKHFLVPPLKPVHTYDMRAYDGTTAVGHCLKKTTKRLSIYSKQLV